MSDIEITGYKCTTCGQIHYPKHERCLECQSRDFEPVQPEGNAKLITWTQIFNLPWGFDERFLIIGVGQFENGLKAMGQVKGDDSEELEIGMELKPTWEPVRQTQSGPVYGLKFEPLG